jgi:hypothetical protein
MKKSIGILAFLLALAFATTGQASLLKDRLTPIGPDKVNIALDTFIIGTHDRYIATIVRDLDEEALGALSEPMREAAGLHNKGSLVLIEKIVFDKNARRLTLVERYLAFAGDFNVRPAAEPVLTPHMQEAALGSLGEFLWDKIAGPGGLGRVILGEDPAPVALSEPYRYPLDQERYAIVTKQEFGGIFLDKSSIQKIDTGLSATLIQSFDAESELHFGGLTMQYTHQPYADALYVVVGNEYCFERKVHRPVRLTMFGPGGKAIYSIRHANHAWIGVDQDPLLPFALLSLRRNLPGDIEKLLADDLAAFDAFVQESIAEAERLLEESGGGEREQ